MKIVLWTIGMILASGVASAAYDVTCNDGDCLRAGWQIQNTQTNQLVHVECFNSACDLDGWVERDVLGRVVSYVKCKADGCFKDGFDLFNNWDRLITSSRCHLPPDEIGERDCLTCGWTSQGDFGDVETYCHKENCWEFGLEVHSRQGVQRAHCKQRGCFKDGWLIF